MAPATDRQHIEPERASACSKCESELDTIGFPLWCKSCRAKYKREYEATKKQMFESRGFAAGMTTMRHYLAQNFQQYGTAGSFTGAEIAAIIARVKDPASA